MVVSVHRRFGHDRGKSLFVSRPDIGGKVVRCGRGTGQLGRSRGNNPITAPLNWMGSTGVRHRGIGARPFIQAGIVPAAGEHRDRRTLGNLVF
jgi:hypothetical protein